MDEKFSHNKAEVNPKQMAKSRNGVYQLKALFPDF